VLEAFGFDRILIETVGVGQTSSTSPDRRNHRIVLVPESGDGIQTLKAASWRSAECM